MTPGRASSGATGSWIGSGRGLDCPDGGVIASGWLRLQMSHPITNAMTTEMNQPGLLPHMRRSVSHAHVHVGGPHAEFRHADTVGRAGRHASAVLQPTRDTTGAEERGNGHRLR